MRAEQLELLEALQALEFSAFDFHLYLDTHPKCQRALAEYSSLVCETQRIRNAYNKLYGPLMAEDNQDLSCWRWALEPWPWDINYQ
jgi:spore coat protein JB